MDAGRPVFLVLSLSILCFTGCPRLDPDMPDPAEELVAQPPLLRIVQNVPGNNIEVRVIDIDPGDEGVFSVYVEDAVNDAQIPVNAKSNSSSVRAERNGDGFDISGIPGGMGVVTFTNRAGTKSAELKVFVRNWKQSEVYRHTLEPDEYNYPLLDQEHNGKYNVSDFLLYEGRAKPFQPSSWAVYKLLIDRGFYYEAPDSVAGQSGYKVDADRTVENWNRGVHHRPHILYQQDDFLGRTVFAFTLHYEFDGDMVGGYADRQRLELKTMNNTWPPEEEAKPAAQRDPKNRMFSMGGGDIFTHRWKFRLPKDFRVSTEYTHIHQIKPEGADNGNPTFTLTARKKSNNQEVMQLIYRGPIREVAGDKEIPSANWYPREMPLEPFRGEWIRAEETVTYDSPGAYRLKLVRIRDMKVLMEWEYFPEQYEKEGQEDPFVMFRKGNTYIRQKTGVYRRIMHMTPFGLPNPDDPVLEFYNEGDELRVLYTDFEMDKWRD